MARTTRKAAKPMTMTAKDTMQQIWLAGLGAFAMASEEGNKLFKTLVKKGETVDKFGKAQVEKALARVEGAREDATAAFGRIGAPIDAGITTALHKLGVPTRKEIQTLTRRVEELTRSVDKRTPARRKAAPRPRRKRVAEAVAE